MKKYAVVKDGKVLRVFVCVSDPELTLKDGETLQRVDEIKVRRGDQLDEPTRPIPWIMMILISGSVGAAASGFLCYMLWGF